jgi:hypothetical protein
MLRKLVIFLVCAAVFAVIGVVVTGKSSPKSTDKWGVTFIDNSTFTTEYYFSADVDDAIADFRGAHMMDYEIVDVCNVSKFTCP